MKKLQYLSAAIWAISILLLLPVGCVDDYARLHGSDTSAGNLSVRYRVDGEMPITRGVTATDHEKTLSKVHLLFFDQSEDSFVGYSTATIFSDEQQISLDTPSAIDADTPYRVLAIGNGDSFMTGEFSTMSAYLDHFTGTHADAKTILAGCEKNVTSATHRHLPLWGYFLEEDGNELTFTKTESGGQYSILESDRGEFLFSRAICRVDIHNLVGHLLDIRYARIANNRTAGYYFLDGLPAGEVAEMNTNIKDPSKSDKYMPITGDMIPGVSTTQTLEASLYTFPNTVATTVQNDRVTTCLLIAGYYIDPETGVKDKDLTFYRFNLANVSESQTLQRNYAYKAVIKGVKRRGATSEKGAYDDTTPIFEYNVDEEWDTTGDNVVSDQYGNFLIVNKTHFTFNGEASDADFMELKVSTNPELTWHVESVSAPGNANDDFLFEQLSGDAVKCGPKSPNHLNYVKYGYFKIVAGSATMDHPLEMYIYLMQLSTQDNVKLLSVNGSTGTIYQRLPPQGGIVTLKVSTGSYNNTWTAVDEDNDLPSWDKDATWTKSGGNAQELQISVPANISGNTRTAKLKVSLSPEDENVQPVYIVLTQDEYDGWYVLSPAVSGPVRINAFSTKTENPNGVMTGTARGFTVTLTDHTHLFDVETTFNEGRDVRLSVGNHLENTATCTHAAYTNPAKLTGLSSGTTFYVNPFRTGPGDPTIRGEVKITVYDPDHKGEPDYQRYEILQFEIVSGADYELNDVILQDESTGVNMLVADRNAGHKSRVKYDENNNPIEKDPFYCLNYHGDHSVYISRNGIDVSDANEAYDDTDKRHRSASGAYADYLSSLQDYWYDRHKDDRLLYSPFYTQAAIDKWKIPDSAEFEKILSHAVYTKWRIFLVSDVDRIRDKKNIPTVCWFHQISGASTDNGTSKTGRERIASYAFFNSTRVDAYYMNTSTHAGFIKSVNPYNWSGATNSGASLAYRMVMDISDAQLEEYKHQYLGY